MTIRLVRVFLMAFLVGGLVLSQGPPVPAQMGPGMMGRPGTRDQGQPPMPVPQMAEVIKQMAERLATRRPLARDKGDELRRLADQLRAAAGQLAEGMGGGMGGMMGGGMMGQASQQMAEMNRILSRMSGLLRDQ